MEILPKNLGTRPRLAVEVRPEGVVAARAADAQALLSAVTERVLPEGVLVPGLKAGNIQGRPHLVAAMRETLDSVAGRNGDRARDVSLVVPDAAVRVLLLDFDELPARTSEALPLVRFRLKKLVPFDADHAAVSYQSMPGRDGTVSVLAVAMPADVLAEYEGAASDAGYTPGAVLPSTLAALSCLDEQESPVLVINADRAGVTTAIVRGGALLLHRTLELGVVPADTGVPGVEPAAAGHTDYDRIEAQAAIETQVIAAESHDAAREIAQAVSVAAAYFEDTLAASPQEIIACGTLGAEGLRAVLEEHGMTGLRVREMVGADSLAATAAARVPRGWIAGVRGALRN